MTPPPSAPDQSLAILTDGDFGEAWMTSVLEVFGPKAVVATTAAEARQRKEHIRYVLAWKTEPGLLAELPNLTAIFSAGAGVDHLLKDPSLPQVPLIRYVDPDMTVRMGEWVTLQVLTHHRQALSYLSQQRNRDWTELNQAAASEVTVGVMGLGELGRHCCHTLKALGFEVLGWSRTPKSVEGVTCFSGSDGLDDFLAETSLLVALLPHTPDTEGLINADLLAKLGTARRHSRFFINAGRGKLQVEADLIHALETGVIQGASLDVFETEPLSAKSPLWEMPGVVITPHVAAISSAASVALSVLRGIAVLEDGKSPANQVERTRGY